MRHGILTCKQVKHNVVTLDRYIVDGATGDWRLAVSAFSFSHLVGKAILWAYTQWPMYSMHLDTLQRR